FARDERERVTGRVELAVRDCQDYDVGIAHHARIFSARGRAVAWGSRMYSQHLQTCTSERIGEAAPDLAGPDDEDSLAHAPGPACCNSPALCSASACEREAPSRRSAAINTRSSCAFLRNSASAPKTYRATSYANRRETSGAASS